MITVPDMLNAHILIVDDQEANVLLLCELLRHAGYQHVSSTMDPTAVVKLHAQRRYDLILLDLQMPVMDGFAVMQQLLATEPSGYLPVLVLTAQPNHKLRALQAGARDFISKPFDLVEVETRIRNMLELRLLYQRLEQHNVLLEQTVAQRTAELRESEARFKSFTELSSDWYWEQDADGRFTNMCGPVLEMLDLMLGEDGVTVVAKPGLSWEAEQRKELDRLIAGREPFIDFIYHRTQVNGERQYLQVSGEPRFDEAGRFIGYRGIGIDITERHAGSQ
ncbi:response regulator [Duganella sp. FT50W]|uniref:Response regulator n=1 Tax=Duganella lactea TaxID=2692173 RepID=A0A6L8ME87_9BURK|nr:response regulator [Duganella lactea]MYM80569.1 response regulator [Duganella lactea]